MSPIRLDISGAVPASVAAALHKVGATALAALHADNLRWATSLKKIVADKFLDLIKKDHHNVTISTQTVLQAFERSPEAQRLFQTARLSLDGPLDRWQRPIKSLEDYVGTEAPVTSQQEYLMNQKIPYFLREAFGPWTDAGTRPRTNTADGGGARDRLLKSQREAVTRRFFEDAQNRVAEGTVRDGFKEALYSALTSVPFVTLNKRDVEMVYLRPEQAMKVLARVGKGRSEIDLEYDGKEVFRINAVRLNGTWLLPLLTRRKTPEEMGVVRSLETLDSLVQVNPILDHYIKANDPIYINTALMRATDEAFRKSFGEHKHKIRTGTFNAVKSMLRSHGAS